MPVVCRGAHLNTRTLQVTHTMKQLEQIVGKSVLEADSRQKGFHFSI